MCTNLMQYSFERDIFFLAYRGKVYKEKSLLLPFSEREREFENLRGYRPFEISQLRICKVSFIMLRFAGKETLYLK